MKVIILCGLPGSGKTTLCQNSFPTYERISQDVLGSRDKCIAKFHELAVQGKDIVVDRTNFSKKQRQIWTDLARHHQADNVLCLYIVADENECVHRIHSRKSHETITEDMPLERKQAIVFKFNEEFEQPDMSENFDSIVMVRS